MAEDQVNQTGDQGAKDQTSLGWRAALPDEYKEHEFVKGFTKPGDFVKSALEIKTERDGLKTERDALKTKTEGMIPKLPDNATDEEKEVFWSSLGKPETPDEYEFPKPADGSEPDPIISKWAKGTFHKANLNNEQASFVVGEWDKFMVSYNAAMIKQEQDDLKSEMDKMKTELGDKYDAHVEMGKRFFKKVMEADFDEKTPVNTTTLLRFVIKAGKLMGEDTSPPGSQGGKDQGKPGLSYNKSPKD